MTVFGKPLRARFAGAALLAIASAVPVLALAQSYPSRPIKMVVRSRRAGRWTCSAG